ncbi:unnamed protein product [Trichobilharzia szidati]|nr:unnamed protein product [Trichobilharzia szidati]
MRRNEKTYLKPKQENKKTENYRDDSVTSISHAPSPVPDFARAISSLSPVSLGRKFRQNDVKRQDIDRISTTAQPPRQSSSRFIKTSHEELKALPLLVETPPGERETLLLNKIRMCSTLFDFNDNSVQLKSKEIKRLTLLELAEFISMNSSSLTEPIYMGIINLLKVNVFRTIVPTNTSTEMLDYADNDDEQMTNLEPSWPHLQLVYDIFLRFISSPDFQAALGKKYLDQQFFRNLLELFKSEDPREREMVKMILHRAYGKLVTLRPVIRRMVNNIFLQFIYEEDNHCGIAELLEIIGSIINGFQTPLKDEHKQFLRRVLLPLHKSPTMGHFHAQLTYCTTEFIKKDSSLFTVIIHEGLLRFWPRVNSVKEMLFLNELEACLECTGPIEFQAIIPEVFPRLAKCIESLHFQVSERALMFWNNEYLLSLMSENINTVLPIIFNSLAESRSHWNKTVHGLICNVLNWAIETDQRLVEQCSSKLTEERQKKTARLQNHEAYWNRVELAAEKVKQSSVNYPVNMRTSSISVSLSGIKNKYPMSNTSNNRSLTGLNEFYAKLSSTTTTSSSSSLPSTPLATSVHTTTSGIGSSTGSGITGNANLVNNPKLFPLNNMKPGELINTVKENPNNNYNTEFSQTSCNPIQSNLSGSSSSVLNALPSFTSTQNSSSLTSTILTTTTTTNTLLKEQTTTVASVDKVDLQSQSNVKQKTQTSTVSDVNVKPSSANTASTNLLNFSRKLRSPKPSTTVVQTTKKPTSSTQKQPLKSNPTMTTHKDTLTSASSSLSTSVPSAQATSSSSTSKSEKSTNLKRTTTLKSLNT